MIYHIFLDKLNGIDPILMESIFDGYNIIFENTNNIIKSLKNDYNVIYTFLQEVSLYQSNHGGYYNRRKLVDAYNKLPLEIKQFITPAKTNKLYRGADGLSYKDAISFTPNKSIASFFGRYIFPFNSLRSYTAIISSDKILKLSNKMKIDDLSIGDDEGEVIVLNPIWNDVVDGFNKYNETIKFYKCTNNQYYTNDYIVKYKFKKIYNNDSILESANDRLKYRILNEWFDTISYDLTKYYWSMIPEFILYKRNRVNKKAGFDGSKTIIVSNMPAELDILNDAKIFFTDKISNTSEYKRTTGSVSTYNIITVNVPQEILDMSETAATNLVHKCKGIPVYNEYTGSFDINKMKRTKIGNDTCYKVYKNIVLDMYHSINKIVNTRIRNIVIHELIHRFDDHILPYSHKNNLLRNSKNINTTSDYLNNKTEINAYIIGSLSELPANISFDDVLKSPMIKTLLDNLTPDNKIRAYKRIYDIWSNK